jgi:hypothetical protein
LPSSTENVPSVDCGQVDLVLLADAGRELAVQELGLVAAEQQHLDGVAVGAR